jgi:hypothetical protein
MAKKKGAVMSPGVHMVADMALAGNSGPVSLNSLNSVTAPHIPFGVHTIADTASGAFSHMGMAGVAAAATTLTNIASPGLIRAGKSSVTSPPIQADLTSLVKPGAFDFFQAFPPPAKKAKLVVVAASIPEGGAVDKVQAHQAQAHQAAAAVAECHLLGA